jgi:hypothetical protein
MSRGVIFLIVLTIIVLVGGALLLIGVLEGDDTDVDQNGVNSVQVLTHPA